MQIDDKLSVVINLLVPKLIRAFIKRSPLVSVATSSAKAFKTRVEPVILESTSMALVSRASMTRGWVAEVSVW
jgi:hypothetical protein